MARTLELNDGVLSEKIVTVSHQPIEVGQLEAEVNTNQEAVNSLTAQIESLNTQLTEAQAALEDSKSDLGVAQELVAQPADAGSESADEQGADGVDIPVAVVEAQL